MIGGHEELRRVERRVRLHRMQGDALARRGDHEGASTLYRTGLDAVTEAVTDAPAPESAAAAGVLAELYGVQGGFHRRLGDIPAAATSYGVGADLERDHDLDTTYNRVNHVKHAVLAGDRVLADLRSTIEELDRLLDERVRARGRTGDDAWLWADRGDVRALLGDGAGAGSAYLVFVDKAQTDAPRTAAAMVEALLAALRDQAGAGAAEARDALQSSLRLLTRASR